MLFRFADDANDITLNGALAAQSSIDVQLARWEQEQLFEEDVRAVLNMLRPNRAERLLGWSEYRTGGQGFRATISWNPGASELATQGSGPATRGNAADEH